VDLSATVVDPHVRKGGLVARFIQHTPSSSAMAPGLPIVVLGPCVTRARLGAQSGRWRRELPVQTEWDRSARALLDQRNQHDRDTSRSTSKDLERRRTCQGASPHDPIMPAYRHVGHDLAPGGEMVVSTVVDNDFPVVSTHGVGDNFAHGVRRLVMEGEMERQCDDL
jgi:hypothetical protein